MIVSEQESVEQQGAAQHLQEALEAEESDEKNYHIRAALQLLGIEDNDQN